MNSAARLVGEGAIRAGLWASQKSDYPVTVKTGHSLVQITMTPQPAPIVPVAAPNALVVLSEEGMKRTSSLLATLPASSRVFATPAFAAMSTDADVEIIDFTDSALRLPKASVALAMGAIAVERLGVYPMAALRDAAGEGPFGRQNLEALEVASEYLTTTG